MKYLLVGKTLYRADYKGGRLMFVKTYRLRKDKSGKWGWSRNGVESATLLKDLLALLPWQDECPTAQSVAEEPQQ